MAGLPVPARPRPEAPPAVAPEGWSPRGLIVLGVVVLYAGACLLWGLYLSRQALLLIYMAALLAVGLGPLVRWLERRRIAGVGPVPRFVAIAIVYVAASAIGVVVVVSVLPMLIRQTEAFVQQLPAMVHATQSWLLAHGVMPRELTFQEIVRQAPVDADAVGTVVATVWSVVGGVLGVVTIAVLSFYFLLETDNIFRTFILLFPRRQRLRVRAAAQQITTKVSGWLNGQLMVAGIIGTTTAVGLALLGVPYFFVLALLAGIGECIPVVGPVLSAVPAVAIASTVSWKLAGATALFFFAQQQLENHLIVPRLMSNQAGVSSVAVLVALLVGASLFGVVGAILAVPTAAIVQVLFYELVPAIEE